MIYFRATPDQIKEIAAKVVNASTPRGLGNLHYDPKKVYKAKHFEVKKDQDIFRIDYFEGRMVKLHIWREQANTWYMHEPNAEYQSWESTYPDVKELIESVGGTLEGVKIKPDTARKIIAQELNQLHDRDQKLRKSLRETANDFYRTNEPTNKELRAFVESLVEGENAKLIPPPDEPRPPIEPGTESEPVNE